MLRWIVTGLLVVVFVGLIVFDETRTESPLAPPPEVLTPEAAPLGNEAVTSVGGEGAVDHAEHEARDQAKADCDPVAAVIEAELGLEKREAIGDAMYVDKGMKPEEVAALCRAVAGQPDEVIVTRFLEASGLTR